ncbi:MAG: hypothetical protein LUC91_01940 [Prevotella sp.]|nr:hypothetical protein [Prevotella sp.]
MFDFIERLFGAHFMRPKLGHNGKNCYSGRYHGGKVTYYYDDFDNGRLYQGRYKYAQKSYTDSFEKTNTKVIGKYDNDLKSGHWKYEFKKKNEKTILEMNYEKGIQNGKYVFKSKRKIHAFGIKKVNIIMTISMLMGNPVGKIRWYNAGDEITGNFDENGKPHGLWVLDRTNSDRMVIGYENWEHGVRINYYTINPSTGQKTQTDLMITSILKNFIKRECTRLEKIETRGSVVWEGNFCQEQ